MFVGHPPSPAFGDDFWQPYTRTAAGGDSAEIPNEASAPGLRYSAQQHGTHADFCGSPEFRQYKEQVRDNLSFLAAFCRAQPMPDAEEIAGNLQTFFSHRFDDPHYFSTRAEIVDSVGKQSLDEFCAMIRNEAADLGRRRAAIRDLSYGVTLCADGAVSNLVSAAGLLAKTIGGIRGKLWELKEATAGHVFRQLVNLRFGHTATYIGNEIHYVNTVWNLLADQFGLEKTPDGVTMAEVARDTDLLATGAAQLNRALTPDRLALLIAEACQTRFNSRMIMDPDPATGRWNPRAEKRCSETLEEIGNEFGLTTSDQIEFDPDVKATTLRESDLRMNSFLEITEDDSLDIQTKEGADEARGDACGYTYTVRTEPSLIALDVLRAMDRINLMQAQTGPQNAGDWVEENGTRAALFVYGELAWMVRTATGGSLQEPVWNSVNTEFEPITLADLLQWQTIRGNGGRLPATAAIRQAIRVTPPEPLARMPASWLKEFEAEDLWRLLQRLGTDHAAGYIANNLSSLGPVGARLTEAERKDFLAHLLRRGLCKAVRGLAEQWIPNESKRVRAVHALLVREAIPAFHRAMLDDNPKAAVQGWYRPLRDSRLLIMIAPDLADLLDTWHSTWPILAHVLKGGRAAAVEAFFAVVKDVLKDPTVRWQMKDELPALLAAADIHGVPALLHTMTAGNTDAVRAYYAGLKDLITDRSLLLTVYPALLRELPDLLVGGTCNGDSGLGFALEKGHADIIVALHAILKDLLNIPGTAPRVRGALPDLLAARLAWGASGLSVAMRYSCPAVIEAFFNMLEDPDIMPHICHAMPDLLNGEDSYGRTGLSNALTNGRVSCIQAYHRVLTAMLNEPALAPDIRRAMPRLINVKNRDGTSGLAYAADKCHDAAIGAFFAILEDPAIAPYIGEELTLTHGGKPEHKTEAGISDRPDRS